ncbi:DUF2147 domain-containing protein [Methylobacterium sp. WL103]|uniref:DUF2147 domain-containing protein n=1 Tax=unclassified Methylobacterium TaxID=2615210 RepID=UPI0011CC9AEE|nr:MULTISPECIES: DUF2147 domain-containing protein [unclassified Methylobacterium]TXM68905.1 DUF2147 domain-containing protein [Methylobacterium sp. WL120]TXM75037.1 DUF2147 domain-containing protein [Methylobacterium sp. WL12]TXM98867.1 DUF2147 domain-containing protein [Methylobacterium sp. WL103]
MRLALASALLLTGLASAHADAGKDPSGTWLTEDGRAKIRIDRCGAGQAQVCGKVVWLKVATTEAGTPRTDIKNPDPKKRSRPVLGLPLIEGLQPDEAKFSGSIYNIEEGKIYQVSLERENASELSVSGCLLKVLCGSQTWTKVPDVNQQAANTASEPAPQKPAKPAAK